MKDCKEYAKAYYQAHKKSEKAKMKVWYEAHKEQANATAKAWYEAHKEQKKATVKAWNEAHKEQKKATVKAYYQAHKEYFNEYTKNYMKNDVNSFGESKNNIRTKSRRYLNKYGTKIPGYQIHHCCTYDDPYKFIYCSKEMHHLIHAYLRQHNIDADSDHFEQIKHLLDDSVVKYNIFD